jgi:hypothetical protein
MSTKNLKLRVYLLCLVMGIVAAAPAFAGSAVIGSVAGSMNATIGGQALMPNAVIFSGDSLQVRDGAAVIAIDGSSRMAFGRQTTVSFLRDSSEVTVLLSRGNLSMYHAQDGAALRVKVGDVTVLPAKGFKTLGEVAMVGDSVVITAKEGSFRVEGNGSALEVAKGKMISLPVKGGAVGAARPSPAGAPVGGDTATILGYTATAAGGIAAILAGIAISRANGAKDAANAATTAATTAGTNAVAAANAAGATALAAGCAVNGLFGDVFGANSGVPSPFTPPSGSTCPAGE